MILGHTHHDHSHESAHDHARSHDHGSTGHTHGPGVLGWMRATFAHSHDTNDKTDDALESSELGIRVLRMSLVVLGFTAILQVAIVCISGSVALLADTIHNFGDAATSIPLWIAFALTRRGVSRRYTYGYGRAEDAAGVVIVLLIFFSACVAGYEAVLRLVHPQIIANTGWVAAAAVIGFAGNEAVAVWRIRVGRQIGSAALVADGMHSRVDGFTSLAVLVGVIGARAGYAIVDPLVGVGITVAILFIVKDAAVSVMRRAMDGVEPEIVELVEHVPTHVDGVRTVHSVRARWVGHKIHADMHIGVDPGLTVAQAHTITDHVEAELAARVRSFGAVVVHICPASDL